MELREAIVAKSMRDSGLRRTPGQVLVTNGGKHAVITAMMTKLNPGDEVLIPAPYWTTYPEAVYLAGGTPVPVMTTMRTAFASPSTNSSERARPKTTLLIFTSPSNPSGAVVRPDDVAAIGRWAAEHDIWVLCDEIYEHLVYGDARIVSMPVVAPELGDRWIVVNGVAKTYAMTGWRVGWMIGAPDVMDAAVNYQSQTTSNISNISQRAAVAALNGDLSAVYEMRTASIGAASHDLDAQRDRRRHVRRARGRVLLLPERVGTVGSLLRGRVANSSTELAEMLLETIKIAVVPGEAFGTPGYFRLSSALGRRRPRRGTRAFRDVRRRGLSALRFL